MGEQMAKRDGPFGGPQSGLARVIKAFEYLWSRKFGQNVCNRVVESELALLNKLHRRSRSDALVMEAIQNTYPCSSQPHQLGLTAQTLPDRQPRRASLP